jgi:two-component system OmpR family sensor kinase
MSAANAPPAADRDPEDQFAITIWNKQGGIIHQSLPGIEIALQSRPGFADVKADGETWHVYTTSDGDRTVQVAQREKVRSEIIRSAALGAAAPIVIVIPLSWLVVGWVMNRMLRRLDALANEVAERTTATEPLPLAGIPSEVAPLVVSMNGLIERLRTAVETQKHFFADAAHELRTPLAAVQIQVGNLANNGDLPDARVASLAAGIKRAGGLVDQLLRLARLDAPIDTSLKPVDIGELLLDCIADVAPIADRKGVDLGAQLQDSARCAAVPAEVQTLFNVLIDNAVRYTPSGGSVDVILRRLGDRPLVEIVDTGPGLPKGEEGRIFDRFYRGAPDASEGTGLGLAIARRIAERHCLSLMVTNRTDGLSGVCAQVALGSAKAAS